MSDDRERLRDIVEAIERIERRTGSGRASLETDELVQTWVIHNIEILGEAARAVSQALRDQHPDIPWREMAAMRSVLAHDYFKIDIERVWGTVDGDLPKLKTQVRAVIAEIERDGGC